MSLIILLLSLILVLVATGSLCLEIWSLKNLRLFEDLSLDCIGSQTDVEAPLLDLLTGGDHSVQLLDRMNSVVRLLEKTLTHSGYSSFVFADLLGNTDEHSKFRRKIDILTFLLDFKQRLVHGKDLLIILLLKVASHGDGCTSFTLFEVASLGAHVKTDAAYFVSLVMTITRHNDSSLKFVLDGFLVLSWGRLDLRVARSLDSKPLHLLVNQLKAVVNRQILANIVNDKI